MYKNEWIDIKLLGNIKLYGTLQPSGRMQDCRIPLLPFRSSGIFVLSRRPCSLSCTNEYPAIASGGNVSGKSSRSNSSVAEYFPNKFELVTEWNGPPGIQRKVL